MNKVIMCGRLSKDPEIRYTQSNLTIASFGIAVDRRTKDKETDFFDCTAFGKTAEHMEKYWHKGMKALISGRVENESWTTKDGQKRISTKIIVEEIEFCEKKGEGNPVESSTENWAPVPEAGNDEELPFKF